jgi:hypothetical protein
VLFRSQHVHWERRASPDQHPGRLLHYTLRPVSVSREDMIAAIEQWCVENKKELYRPGCTNSTPYRVENGHKLHRPGCTPNSTAQGVQLVKSTPPRVENTPKSTPPAVTRNKNKNIEEEYSAVDRAFAAYNNAAHEHGFSVCHKLTDARRKRIQKRLDDIGGLDQFTLALSAIPGDNFLMGKVAARKSGERPFKLELESLLSTESGLADVLAKLIDRALNSKASALDDFEAEVVQFADTEIGRKMRQGFRDHDKGMELIRSHVKAQREARMNGSKPNGAHHG